VEVMERPRRKRLSWESRCEIVARILRREAGVLHQLEQLPAAALAFCRDRPALRLEAGAAVALPVCPHLTTVRTCMGARPSCATAPLTAARARVEALYSKHSML
jgi:hypothetical protein